MGKAVDGAGVENCGTMRDELEMAGSGRIASDWFKFAY